jgi:hypothetical protein
LLANICCRDSILYRLVLAYLMAHDNWSSQHNITVMCRAILHIMCSFPAITRQTHNTFPHLHLIRILTHLHISSCIFPFHCTSSQEHPSIVQPVPWCVPFQLLLYLTILGIVQLLFHYGPLLYLTYILRALPISFQALGRRLCAT